MADFLASMAASSRERVQTARIRESLTSLRRRAAGAPPAPGLRLTSFDLIAEIKLASPSAGRLAGDEHADAEAVASRARAYARAGAAAISVLTEPTRFGGDLAHLAAAARAASVPCMRKDFLVDPYQVFEARAAGAGGVLLIVRMLGDSALRDMLAAAAEADVFVLLEAFDEEDLARAGALLAAARQDQVLIGLNTRDLRTLEVDRSRLVRLTPAFPRGGYAARVAESGIESGEDAAHAAALGYNAALVGTALMRARDPEAAIRAMLAAGRARATAGAEVSP